MSKRGIPPSMVKAKRRKRTSKKKEFDINKLVNIAVKTGKVIIGTDSLRKFINISEDLKIMILAKNCPEEIRKSFQILVASKKENENTIPIYTYPFSSWELGTAVGKPFMITALGIIDQGDSGILDSIQKQQKAPA